MHPYGVCPTTDEAAAHVTSDGWTWQVLRAAVMAADPAGGAHMRDPGRSLLKPELIWQYEKGFSQTPEEVSHHLAHVQASQRLLLPTAALVSAETSWPCVVLFNNAPWSK